MHIQPAFPEGPVVILGASYAHGWNPGIAGRRTVNKGINGQQSWELRERFDRDVVAERPRAVVIWGFFNDIVRSARPKMDDTLDRVRQSVSGMVEAARTARIEPILATEVTMRHPDTWSDSIKATVGWLLGRQSYQEYINSYIVRTNQWLREYAVREGLLLLDLQPVVSDRDGRRQRAFAAPDGSHISPAGYDALTRYASPLIASRLSAQ
jgi:lysophospholipase L1-like esterase